MTDMSDGRPFAHGLVLFGWVSIALLGPIALFLTWYGDCFAEVCPTATTSDGVVYGFDVIAWIAVGLIALLPIPPRYRRRLFGVAALFGLAFAAQGVASLLGVRGFYAFAAILPAATILFIGGVLGARATADRWASRSAASAFSLGCATYFVGSSGFFGIASAVAGQPVGLLLAFLVVALVGIVATLSGRFASQRRTAPGDIGDAD